MALFSFISPVIVVFTVKEYYIPTWDINRIPILSLLYRLNTEGCLNSPKKKREKRDDVAMIMNLDNRSFKIAL